MSSAITTSGDQLAPPRPAIRDRRAVARTLLTIFIFPWIFDVRAQAGAEWLLVIQLLSFISTTVIFVVAIKVFKRRVDLGSFAGNRFNLGVAVLFLSVAMLSGFLEHNETFKIFAFSIPTILFVYSILMIVVIAESGLRPEEVIGVVATMAIIAVLIRIPIIALLFGFDFGSVRYQIASAGTGVAIAYILARIPGGLKPREIAFAIAQALIILLAVTRSALLTVALMAGVLISANWRRSLHPKTLLFSALGVPLFLAVIYFISSQLPGDQMGRWLGRMSSFQSGTVDMSGLERESQILYQIQQLSGGGSIQKLIGFGIAAPGGNYGPLELYAASHGVHNIYVPTGFADNTYISIFFLAGVLGGGPLLLAQFAWLWNSLRAVSFVFKRRPKSLSWLAMAPLGVIGFQISNVLGASFADRGESIFFGLCLGITGWLTAIRRRETLKKKKKKRAASPTMIAPPALENA